MNHPLPAAALAHTIAFVGRTGSGKTYAAKTAVESILDAGGRVCIIDPTGVWFGLRRRADGSDGFPVVIFGGEHADVPITDAAGETLGELVATAQIHSAIVDVSELTGGETTRFLTAFFEALYARANRAPLTLVMDEADVMAPQQPLPDQRRLQGAVNKIVRRGRVKGFRPIMITQRPAVIDKSVLSQVSTLVAMRLTSPQDRKAIEDWVKGNADAAQARAVLESLPGLSVGEGWVWSPAEDVLERAKFPPISTFDSSRTPEHGETVPPPPALSEIDVGALREILAEEVDENPATGAQVVHRASKAELDQAFERGRKSGWEQGFDEGAKAAAQRMRQWIDNLEALVSVLRDDPDPEISTPSNEAPKIIAPSSADTSPAPRLKRAGTSKPETEASGSVGPERRPLAALVAAYPGGLTEAQWATAAGMKRKGGTWGTYKSRLRTGGRIRQEGDLWFATEAGVAVLGDDAPRLPEGPKELLEFWADKVGPAGRLLRHLGSRRQIWIDREALATELDMAAGGGTFTTYLSRLRSNGLIVEDAAKRIRLADEFREQAAA